MPCGPNCACLAEPGVECLSVIDPARFGHFKFWCESGDEAKRRHVLGRSRIGLSPAPASAPVGQPPPVTPQPAPTPAERLAQLPLAGNLVAAMTKRMGVDWVVKAVAEELGVDCGCSKRQEDLNRLDAKFRRFLGW